MAEEAGIVMKRYDEVSTSLKSIAGQTRAFDKDMDDLRKSVETYDKIQTTLTGRMANLKKAMAENNVQLKEAQKAYRRLKDEAGKGALNTAIEEQVRLKREMNETRAAIDENAVSLRKFYQEAGKAAAAESRFSNRAESRTGSWAKGRGLIAALNESGILNMAGDAAGELANALAGSALGSQGANLFSGALSGAVSGAALGRSCPALERWPARRSAAASACYPARPRTSRTRTRPSRVTTTACMKPRRRPRPSGWRAE